MSVALEAQGEMVPRRGDDEGQAFSAARIGVSISQERRRRSCMRRNCALGGNQVHKACRYAGDLGVDGDQIGQKLLGAERAQGVSTLKLCQMQCHVAACLCEGC
jgi:hypothetical protein